MKLEDLGKILNRTPQSISNKARRLGLTSSRRKGKINGNWKGGISQLADGYVRDNISGKRIHTKVVEEFLDRELIYPEMVHHINGIKNDNRLENLVYCKDRSFHRLLHCQLEQISFELVQKGIIKFDKSTDKYYIDEAQYA